MTVIESQVVVIYGPAKLGKTTDLGYAFPTGLFFAPSASSLLPLKNVVGIKPKMAVVDNLIPIYDFVRAHATDATIPAIVIDDIALLADASVSYWQTHNPNPNNGWYAYQKIAEVCQAICVIARRSPWHLVLDSHERSPELDDAGIFQQGGPVLPGRKAGPAIEKNAALILHAERSNPLGSNGACDDSWPVIYTCDPANKNFITGDRNGFALPKNPMNLRAILGAGGIALPYPSEWMGKAVGRLVALALEKKLESAVLDDLTKGNPQSEIDWVLRDARAALFMARNQNRRSELVRAGLLGAV